MYRGFKPAVLALAAAGLAPGAHAAGMGSVCLTLSEIDHTEILDDQTVLFTMHDGAVWENLLPELCGGLKAANGFDYIGQEGSGTEAKICGNIDLIHVADANTSCALGPFVLYQAKQ